MWWSTHRSDVQSCRLSLYWRSDEWKAWLCCKPLWPWLLVIKALLSFCQSSESANISPVLISTVSSVSVYFKLKGSTDRSLCSQNIWPRPPLKIKPRRTFISVRHLCRQNQFIFKLCFVFLLRAIPSHRPEVEILICHGAEVLQLTWRSFLLSRINLSPTQNWSRVITPSCHSLGSSSPPLLTLNECSRSKGVIKGLWPVDRSAGVACQVRRCKAELDEGLINPATPQTHGDRVLSQPQGQRKLQWFFKIKAVKVHTGDGLAIIVLYAFVTEL